MPLPNPGGVSGTATCRQIPGDGRDDDFAGLGNVRDAGLGRRNERAGAAYRLRSLSHTATPFAGSGASVLGVVLVRLVAGVFA